MRALSFRAWGLVVVSALLQVAMFPTGGAAALWRFGLSWFALVPLLAALMGTDRSGSQLNARQGAALGYGCGIFWYLGNCSWIFETMHLYGGLPKPVAAFILLLFALYLGLYHAMFAGLFVFLQRSRLGAAGALAMVPLAWVAVELARGRVTGFPWDLLGDTQVDNAWVTRLAPFVGVMGISLVVAATNAALAYALSRHGRIRVGLSVLIVIGVLTVEWFGTINPVGPRSLSATMPVAILMQENINVGAVGKLDQPLTLAQEYEDFVSDSLEPVNAASLQTTEHPAVIVWPEAPSHFQSNDPYFRRQLGGLAAARNVPVIVGSLGVDADASSSKGYFLYDSASLFTPQGSYAGRYDKIHLVPWGEYVPFKQLFSFAEKLTEGVGNMDRGTSHSVFHSGVHAYGVFICYESIFGDEVREFAQRGADVLVNISDDGWYGDSGAPWQHLNMTRMRAIENHRRILLATNTGITTAIDPQGRTTDQAPRHVRAAYIFPFDYVQGTTFYTRHGDWLAWLCAVATLAAVAVGFVTRDGLKSKYAE